MPAPVSDAERSGVTVDAEQWDEDFDVVVVGFGAAGSAAALEARHGGARVLVIDRFQGGGATARSGGVIYAGGGTALQEAAGYEDAAGQMFEYLRLEVGEAVGESVLRSFCQESVSQIDWLEGLGVRLPTSGTAPCKTSYPEDSCTLYFSGNELAAPFREKARPAPRGHRVAGKGRTGGVLFHQLRTATAASGAEIRTACHARRLITNPSGGVDGVEIVVLDPPPGVRRLHAALFEAGSWAGLFSRPLARLSLRGIRALEERYGRTVRIRARGGVVLCTGGFVFNDRMMREYAGAFAGARPLGTLGDDGSGISLGLAAGGTVGEMERCSAWRFIDPPAAFVRGVLVDANGRRICNEEYYGATLGRHIAARPGGRAFLVIDANQWKRAGKELRERRDLRFQVVMGWTNRHLNRRKARSIARLGEQCGMPHGALEDTIERYNEDARRGRRDSFGKSAGCVEPLDASPFHAIDCSLGSLLFPAPCMTLGGLRVEDGTGRVLRPDGSAIDGLHAAGSKRGGRSRRGPTSAGLRSRIASSPAETRGGRLRTGPGDEPFVPGPDR